MTEELLGLIQAEQVGEEDSVFSKNYSKTIIKLTFAIAFAIDGTEESENLIYAMIQCVYSSFKT